MRGNIGGFGYEFGLINRSALNLKAKLLRPLSQARESRCLTKLLFCGCQKKLKQAAKMEILGKNNRRRVSIFKTLSHSVGSVLELFSIFRFLSYSPFSG